MVFENGRLIGTACVVAAVYVIASILLVPAGTLLNVSQVALALQLCLLFLLIVFNQPATSADPLARLEALAGPVTCLTLQAVLGIVAPLLLQGVTPLVVVVALTLLAFSVVSSVGLGAQAAPTHS